MSSVRFASYSSRPTWFSVMRGVSNCRQTSLTPMKMESQSGWRSSTSVCQQVPGGIAAGAHIDDPDPGFGVGHLQKAVHQPDVAFADGVEQPFAAGAGPVEVGDGIADEDQFAAVFNFHVASSVLGRFFQYSMEDGEKQGKIDVFYVCFLCLQMEYFVI